jgi:hypothetical protein
MRRGLRGPEPAILTTKSLDEYDRKNKISDEDANLSLTILVRLYPPPRHVGENYGTPVTLEPKQS